MKSRIPREWQNLSPAQKKKINEYLIELLDEQEEKDMRLMLDLFIKMSCALIHDLFGHGEKHLTMYVGSFQMMFKEQARLVSKGEQLEFLDKRMAKIFRKNGFPQDFIDRLIGAVDEDAVSGNRRGIVDEGAN